MIFVALEHKVKNDFTAVTAVIAAVEMISLLLLWQ
jgi:hypothetical protein